MAKHTETRIEERTRLAEMHRRDQGFIMRAVSGTGLAIANTWDRITQPFKSDRGVFAGATAFGVARGAVLGGVIGLVAIAASATVGAAGVLAAPFAIPIFLTATLGGAVIAGVKDGQSKLERHWQQPNDAASDKIAQMTGAVPGPNDYLKQSAKNVQYDVTHPAKASKVLARANAALNKEPDSAPVDGPSYVERLAAERAKRGGPTVLH